jgi:hypothetical protein
MAKNFKELRRNVGGNTPSRSLPPERPSFCRSPGEPEFPARVHTIRPLFVRGGDSGEASR